ncbi:MAG: T9SS type A sorting domain-containing protein [Flavobacteriales bacterium]|nr:T9SS type A sorting domain-containing protein [Flavobacteriales bacterium]
MLRKFFLCGLGLVLGLGLNAQHWTSSITSDHPTFHEIQQAFNDHWEPYDVKDGWYVDQDGVRSKAPGWKQFKRWEWYWQQRTGPSGEFPSNLVECQEWEKIAKDAHQPLPGYFKGTSNWTSLGPSTSNNIAGIGRINCIAFHPTNPNTFWVGTPAGGMWKTTNGGNSWTTNTDGLPVLGVSWIAIHPTQPNTMYIATGDGDAASSLSAFGQPLQGDTKSIGILKSTNGGNTWTTVLSAQQSDGVLIRKVMIDPAFPDYVYAATSLGIYQSTDAGSTWNNILGGYFMDMEFNPGNSDIVYAASYDPNGNAQVFVTDNFGQNWYQVTALSGVNRIDIAVTPASPNAVDILCSDANTHAMHSMHYSLDAGVNWAPYWFGGPGYNLLGWMGDASDNQGQGSYDLTLAIDPANYNNIYVGGVNLWRTTNGGANWSVSNIWTNDPGVFPPPNPQVVHADKHHVTFHPLQPGVLFDCNDGGVYKSTNGGNTWTDLSNGIVNSQMYSISSAQTDPGILLAGLQDNGSIGYETGSWQELTGGDGMMCHVDPTTTNYLYTTYANGVIYRISLAPPGIATISENIPGGQPQGEWVTPFALDPGNPATIYAGYEQLWRSPDRGNSWVQLGTPWFGQKMNYLGIAPSATNVIYAGYLNAIFRSANGGTNWQNVTANLPVSSAYISGFSIDPTDPNAVVVTLSGYSAGNKVYVTTNGGGSWVNVTNTGLPNLPVNCSQIDALTGNVYLGTDAGVYLYDSQTTSWQPFNMNLPNVVVTDLDAQYSSGSLRAGTFGRGLWETQLLSVGLDEENTVSDLLLFPNPASDRVTVRTGNLLSRIRAVRLFNNLGQQVYNTANIPTDGGEDLVLDVSRFDAGVYHLSIETNYGVRTQRLVVE